MAIDRLLLREAFFTPESIDRRSSEMIERIRTTVGIREYVLNPDTAALLIVDMQHYFLSHESRAFVPSAPAIVANITDLAHAFVGLKRPVIATRHIDSTDEFSMMKIWWPGLIKASNPRSEIIPEILNLLPEVIIKPQYDAFYKTSLEESLRDSGTRQLIVCGVMTHLCCETTARSAFVRGFEVMIPVDANATFNMDLHRGSLTNLSHGFANITLTRDLSRQLTGNTDVA